MVSRVLMRIRRQQSAIDLQQEVTQITKRKLSKIQDLAEIIAPNQNSVQSFKNRIVVLRRSLTVFLESLKNTMGKVYSGVPDVWKGFKTKVFSRLSKSSLINVEAGKKEASSQPSAGKGKFFRRVRQEGIMQPSIAWRQNVMKFTVKVKLLAQKGMVGVKNTARHGLEAARRMNLRRKAAVKTVMTPQMKKVEAGRDTLVMPKPVPVMRIVREATVGSLVSREKPPVVKQASSVIKGKAIRKLFSSKEDGYGELIERAKVALDGSQINEAEAILVPYLVKHPRDKNAYMLLGKAALGRKNWGEAVEIFEQVLRLDPGCSRCYASLGWASYEAGNLTKAIEFLQKARDAEPDNTSVIQQLYKIACRMDNLPMQHSLLSELERLRQKEATSNQLERPREKQAG